MKIEDKMETEDRFEELPLDEDQGNGMTLREIINAG